MTTADDDLRALGLIAHLEDERLHPVAPIETLVRDPLRAGHERLSVPQVQDAVAVVHLLHDAGDQIAFSPFIEVVHLIPLGLAQPLHDDLLGGLRRDAAEVIRGVLPLAHHVAVLVQLLAVHGDLPAIGVDHHPRLLRGAGAALVGRHQSVGEGVEDRVDGDASLALEQLEGLHHLQIHPHRFTFLEGFLPGFGARSQRNTVRAHATSAYGMRRRSPPVTTTKPSSSASSRTPRCRTVPPSSRRVFTSSSLPNDLWK